MKIEWIDYDGDGTCFYSDLKDGLIGCFIYDDTSRGRGFSWKTTIAEGEGEDGGTADSMEDALRKAYESAKDVCLSTAKAIEEELEKLDNGTAVIPG